MSSGLSGNYHVSPIATAICRGWKLCGGKMREYQLLRRHALKLAFWPDGGGGPADADIDWDWVKSLERFRIGELRIDELINGNDNVRVIFFKANLKRPEDRLTRIWLMTVYQKKRWEFTPPELAAFKAQRQIIVKREYNGSPEA